ncbi:MAG: propanediol utilization protein [Bacillus sp. (in: firmicutes)]
MKVTAMCPASCGELIQGWIRGSEKLISYPIDLYSKVTVQLIQDKHYAIGHSKVWEAFKKTCAFYDLREKAMPAVSITVDSDIPRAKGMASSTADIAATIVATAELFGKQMTPERLAQICLEIEPTDSTIFPSLTLFDHLTGETIIQSHFVPRFGVIVLEPMDMLDTKVYRKRNHEALLLQQEFQLKKAMQQYEQAVVEKSISKLGQAATISAEANQAILPKKRFPEMMKMLETLDLLGVNVAHSGTVLGLMFDENKIDPVEIIASLHEKNILNDYPIHHIRHSVEGGVTLK